MRTTRNDPIGLALYKSEHRLFNTPAYSDHRQNEMLNPTSTGHVEESVVAVRRGGHRITFV